MRRLRVLAGVALALALPAPAAATDFSVTTLADLDGSAARGWAPIASGGMNISDQVGVARTSDRVLHVAWRRRAAGQDLLQTPVTRSGRVGSPVTVAGGWAAVGSPALVARGRALSAFFPGSATLTTGDPTYGLDLATSGDAGASWSVRPAAIARDEFAFARTPAAVLTTAGRYLQAWSGTAATVVHAGPRSSLG